MSLAILCSMAGVSENDSIVVGLEEEGVRLRRLTVLDEECRSPKRNSGSRNGKRFYR